MNTKPATAPAPHTFTLRLPLGLIGVLIAALTSGLIDRVSDIALADKRCASRSAGANSGRRPAGQDLYRACGQYCTGNRRNFFSYLTR